MQKNLGRYGVSTQCVAHSQRLSIVRYTTGNATEIQPQWDSNPVLSSTSQLVLDMRLSDPKLTGLPLLVNIKLFISDNKDRTLICHWNSVFFPVTLFCSLIVQIFGLLNMRHHLGPL